MHGFATIESALMCPKEDLQPGTTTETTLPCYQRLRRVGSTRCTAMQLPRLARQDPLLRHDCPPLLGLWARLSGTTMGSTREPATSTTQSTGHHIRCYWQYSSWASSIGTHWGLGRERASERHWLLEPCHTLYRRFIRYHSLQY